MRVASPRDSTGRGLRAVSSQATDWRRFAACRQGLQCDGVAPNHHQRDLWAISTECDTSGIVFPIDGSTRAMTETEITDFSIDILYDAPKAGSMDGTPDGRYVFWFEPSSDGRQRAWINGSLGEPFDELVSFADGRPWLISDRGGRFAYVVRRGSQAFVGADDREYGPYGNLSRQIEPFFSPDDRHLVFAVLVGDDVRLVVDGTELPGVRPAAGRPLFSPDGSRLAYVAARKDAGVIREWVILDGQAQTECDGIGEGTMVFSSDGRRFAYGRRNGSVWEYVLDDQASPPFKQFEPGVFSANGSRFAYPAFDGRMWLAVDSDRTGPPFERVSPIVFSGDSSRMAYVGVEAKSKLHVVIDGTVGPAWHELWGSPAFSADGRRTAYLAQEVTGGLLGRRQTWRAVIDGTPGRSFDEVASEPHFSPDGRLAFSARSGRSWSMVVDDVPGSPFDTVGPPIWSTSGRLAHLVKTGGELAVVLDGTMGPQLTDLSALDGKMIMFSPDGRHVLYLGTIRGALHPVVDHRLGPAVSGLDHPRFDANSVSFLGLHDDKVVRLRLPLD